MSDDYDLGPRPNFIDAIDYRDIWLDQSEGRYRTGRMGRWSESGEDPEDLCRLPYLDYLKTSHWQIVRERALADAQHQCFYCGATDQLDVHHLTYARRGCEFDEDLMVLCRKCHDAAHGRRTKPNA